MFAEWDSFYLLVGSASGGLIGLLFVVATLSAGRDGSLLSQANRTYITPVVFHFAVVFYVSGIAFVPGLHPVAAGLLIAGAALAGLVYCGIVSLRLARGLVPTPPHWTDLHFYGLLPAVAYVCLVVSAAVVAGASEAGATGIAGSALALLLIGVRNAWDLVTFLVQNPPPQKEGS